MKTSKAFSIIELNITLALVSILIVFSIPKLSFFHSFLIKSEVEKLYTVFSYLQQKAIASNSEQKLMFSPETNNYTYNIGKTKQTYKLPKQVSFGFLDNTKGPPATPTKTILKPVTFNKKMITFFANGKISPGTAYIIDKNKKHMKAITCPVSQVSYIRKYAYHENKWVNF